MSAEPWQLRGHYMECCTCREVCPCMQLGNPTEGTCTGLVGWHIETGHYGRTALDGLNVAVALHTPGRMADGNWQVVLYLDAAGDDSQREALAQIFGGEAGGHPAVLTSFIGELLGVEHVPIHYTTEGDSVRLTLGDSDGATVQANLGQGDEPVTLDKHPLAVAPGFPAVMATSSALRHQRHGIELDLSERTAAYSPFSYAGP